MNEEWWENNIGPLIGWAYIAFSVWVFLDVTFRDLP